MLLIMKNIYIFFFFHYKQHDIYVHTNTHTYTCMHAYILCTYIHTNRHTHTLSRKHTYMHGRGSVNRTGFPLSVPLSITAVATAQSDGKQEVPNSRTSFLRNTRKCVSAGLTEACSLTQQFHMQIRGRTIFSASAS